MMTIKKAHEWEKTARYDLKKIFYKNETEFTFEKYVTKIKGIFNVLDKYGILLYEEHMVEHLIDQIISPNKELNTEVNICRFSHSSKFIKESMYLSTVVTIL